MTDKGTIVGVPIADVVDDRSVGVGAVAGVVVGAGSMFLGS